LHRGFGKDKLEQVTTLLQNKRMACTRDVGKRGVIGELKDNAAHV
jgi:hypothetical protein